MKPLDRLIAPASLLSLLLPVVAINLVGQLLHLAGWVDYDGEKASYIVSLVYVLSICMEAAAIWRERKVR